MSAALHLVTSVSPERADSLRPECFDDYIGQPEVIANLRQSVRASKRGAWQLDHVLLAGPAGIGKTSCAQVIANELGARCHVTSAPAIEHKGTLASLLTTLANGDVLFIDEIHALGRALAEPLYSALEDRAIDLPAGKRVIRVPLCNFTLVGATTHAGKLPKPLRDRFGIVCQLRTYTTEELAAIVVRSASKLGVAIDDDGATVIAQASRGTPRIANRLLRRVRDAAVNTMGDGAQLVCGERSINGSLAAVALAHLGIDQLGLDQLDRRYLALVAERPLGIEAICAQLGEDRSTVEDAIEPWLLCANLITRERNGRVATAAGLRHCRQHAATP